MRAPQGELTLPLPDRYRNPPAKIRAPLSGLRSKILVLAKKITVIWPVNWCFPSVFTLFSGR